MAGRIEDYAMIGDMRTAALVGRDGSIDWFCAPRFDSAACFAALLGKRENGRWKIGPRRAAKVRRHYQDGGLILETQFENEGGKVSIIDFMPVDEVHTSIVRLVIGLKCDRTNATRRLHRRRRIVVIEQRGCASESLVSHQLFGVQPAVWAAKHGVTLGRDLAESVVDGHGDGGLMAGG